jgi:LysR family transcriptional regulator (chromosome initiation inhibitor)
MQDYHGIEALSCVLMMQSFEKAALKLHITQSAVSQRIKNLESYYGEPILIRTLPYRPTKLGNQLIRLLAQIQLLEENFVQERAATDSMPKCAIALNRDSLETWFLGALSEKSLIADVIVEIIADDQEHTLEYFKNGLVSACLSTESKALKGAEAVYLGTMKYILTASQQFLKRYEFQNDLMSFFRKAPALQFDRNDHLHERYLKHYFANLDAEISYKIIPSVYGFKKYALLGFGYGLIPEIDIADELKTKKLLNMFPTRVWETKLYWHMWSIKSVIYEKFNTEIIKYAQKILSV